MNQHTIEDAYIVAFLAQQGHHFTPVKQPNGRVVFKIDEDYSESLQKLFDNQDSQILNYIKQLKMVKSTIFSYKN